MQHRCQRRSTIPFFCICSSMFWTPNPNISNLTQSNSLNLPGSFEMILETGRICVGSWTWKRYHHIYTVMNHHVQSWVIMYTLYSHESSCSVTSHHIYGHEWSCTSTSPHIRKSTEMLTNNVLRRRLEVIFKCRWSVCHSFRESDPVGSGWSSNGKRSVVPNTLLFEGTMSAPFDTSGTTSLLLRSRA